MRWIYNDVTGLDKAQVQQKRYRYTGKERDDSSGLCYYGARYLAHISVFFYKILKFN
jgi:RHS repeat-associated protein